MPQMSLRPRIAHNVVEDTCRVKPEPRRPIGRSHKIAHTGWKYHRPNPAAKGAVNETFTPPSHS